MKKLDLNLGQIGLAVVLLVVVVLTMGLSVASRQVTDVRLSKQEEETSRAFNLAEAGVEYTLESVDFGVLDEDLTMDLSNLPEGEEEFVDLSLNLSVTRLDEIEAYVEAGETMEVDVDGGTATELVVDWGKGQDCETEVASLEMTVYYEGASRDEYLTRTYSFAGFVHSDPADNFTEVGGAMEGATLEDISAATDFCRRATLTLDSAGGDDVLVVLRPIYNGTTLYAKGGGGALPDQYYQIKSVGSSDIGEETRAIQVLRSKPRLDPIFHYAIYSGGDLVK